ncbi:putative short-chain dehydrogenase [Diplodia seriata]|uniref:Putative short-chain dehydrogenase n=1 Tax=Diplodia seriata TaxID=420778 RepID=A0A0G2FNZ6_9PEZI|nr:putative short-chain dehydrogenase [Diplodia seriata]
MATVIGNLFDVKGRIALVTGGSSGIGLMIAKALVTNGARVIITALPTDPIDAAVRDLNALGRPSGGTAEGFPTDLSSKPAIAALAAHLTDTLRLPRLDVLVSNAGIRRDPPAPCAVTAAALPELQASMWSHRAADWADTFAVNTTAHYFLSVALVHLLAAAAERDVEAVQVSAAPEGGGEGGIKLGHMLMGAVYVWMEAEFL